MCVPKYSLQSKPDIVGLRRTRKLHSNCLKVPHSGGPRYILQANLPSWVHSTSQ